LPYSVVSRTHFIRPAHCFLQNLDFKLSLKNETKNQGILILLPYIDDEQEAVDVSKAVLQALSEPFRLEDRGDEIAVSGSIGICISPRDGADCKTLPDRTDSAMHMANRAAKTASPCLGGARAAAPPNGRKWPAS